MRGAAYLVLSAGLWVAAAPGAQGAPYVDPTLLDVPWGNYSFTRQGWRGYLETVPAARFRQGLGIVWGQTPPGKSADEVAAMLAWAGFQRVRLEIPWGDVAWDETGLTQVSAQRVRAVLKALKHHGLRPLVLLNANHLQPCPVRWREFRVQRAAPAGARMLIVSGDAGGLQPGQVTVMSLADGVTAGPLIDEYDAYADGTVRATRLLLSKPLGRRVGAGEVLRAAVLRYAPLYPVGSPQFEATTQGWLRYVELVTRLVESSYGTDYFDVEIWNELTFGSAFLDIANYRDAPRDPRTPEFLHPGGSAWELARRTSDLLKRSHPHLRVIWGFSNSTFFHVKIPELPGGMDGQSYHPYGTGRRCFSDLVRGKRQLLLDDYVPQGCAVQPEGYAQAWQQTESLLRFLAPAARGVHPPNSVSFAHFITEHGFAPAEIGITDGALAARARAAFVLRAALLWLNKGLTALYVFDAYEPGVTGFGILGEGDKESNATLSSLRRVNDALAGPDSVLAGRQLSLEVEREGAPMGVLPGDPDGRYLPQQDAAAFLPYQTHTHRFVVASYVMTQDFPRPLAPQPYRVTVRGLDGRGVQVRYLAPESGNFEPATILAATADSVTLRLFLTETPRLLELQEAQRARRAGDS